MKDGASSSNPPPPLPLPLPPSALLAPGFRFHPTDEELVIYYLKRKIIGRPLRVDAIGEIEIYRSEPWDLPAVSRLKSRDAEWFFFSHLDRKYSNRTRTNRATPGGYWKTTGKDRAVRHGPRTVGMKKTLVYHNGRAPRGDRTNWVMHEYRLEDEELAGSGIAQDGYVVCKIFQKSGPGPQNGAQYGGPFVEEEWEEDSNLAQEVPGGNSHDYMQITDFEQVQDRVDQPENMGLSVANSDVQNSGSGAEDPFLVNEIFHDQGFDGVIATPTDVFGGNNDLAIVPSHAASTHINEYLELNDLANYPSDHLQDESNGLNQQDYEFDEFFDTVDRTTDPADFQLSPNADDLFVLLSPINGEYPSDQLAEDNAVFYDAPGHGFPSANEGTVHESDSLNLPSRVDEAVFGPLDDIMAYFDDTDDYIHFSALDSSSGLQPVGSSSSNQPNFAPEDDGSSVRLLEAEPHDIAGQGFSSSMTLPEADHPMDSLNDEVNTESEANHGTISKHLVRMLGSISAPPALAAEFPSSPIKLSEQTLASSSIHVTASLIQIRGFQVVGSASRKDGDVSFLLSCGVTSGDVDGCKLRGWAMSVAVLMRGGLCGFFLWAMFLAMCCKIGIRVYCR